MAPRRAAQPPRTQLTGWLTRSGRSQHQYLVVAEAAEKRRARASVTGWRSAPWRMTSGSAQPRVETPVTSELVGRTRARCSARRYLDPSKYADRPGAGLPSVASGFTLR